MIVPLKLFLKRWGGGIARLSEFKSLVRKKKLPAPADHWDECHFCIFAHFWVDFCIFGHFWVDFFEVVCQFALDIRTLCWDGLKSRFFFGTTLWPIIIWCLAKKSISDFFFKFISRMPMLLDFIFKKSTFQNHQFCIKSIGSSIGILVKNQWFCTFRSVWDLLSQDWD